MSPIKKENRDRYPVNWKAISRRIRRDRAGWRCECTGQCGTDHEIPALGIHPPHRCNARNGRSHPVTLSKVVLTVAHLDHTPENCADTNLLAMCQRCHLAYDGSLGAGSCPGGGAMTNGISEETLNAADDVRDAIIMDDLDALRIAMDSLTRALLDELIRRAIMDGLDKAGLMSSVSGSGAARLDCPMCMAPDIPCEVHR